MASLFELYYCVMCHRLINGDDDDSFIIAVNDSIIDSIIMVIIIFIFFISEDNYYCVNYITNHSVEVDNDRIYRCLQ